MAAAGIALWVASPAPDDRSSAADQAPAAGPTRPRIAILPFQNLSAEPEREYFADGMTHDLMTHLSQVSGLLVLARIAVFAYQDSAADTQLLARELGVRYILQGSVRKAGTRLRINSQLTEQEQDLLARRYADNPDAYDYFLRGPEHYFRLTADDNARAQELYRKAIESDPAFGRAYGALSVTHARSVLCGWSESPERAIAADPNYAEGYGLPAWIHSLAGHPERSLEILAKAMDIDPAPGGLFKSVLGEAQYWSGRLDERRSTFEEIVASNPNVIDSRLHLAAIYSGLGQHDEAERQVQ